MAHGSIIFAIILLFGSQGKGRHFHGIQKYYHKYALYLPPSEITRFKQSRLCTASNDGGAPYRYYKPTRQCYVVGERGPCGEMMAFTLIDRDYGTCDCSQKERCGRPLIYWPEGKRCYTVNEQGPCMAGKWLTFGMYLRPVCRRNICEPQMRRDPSRGTHFWFEHGGQCFKTGSQGYCAQDETLLNQWADYKPKCYHADAPLNCSQTQVPSIACLPGMRHNMEHECIHQRHHPQLAPQNLPLPNIYHLKLE